MGSFVNIFLVFIFTVTFPAVALRSFKIAYVTGEYMGFILGTLAVLGIVTFLVRVPIQYRSAEIFFALPALLLGFYAYRSPVK